jgi:ligand-binding SRPBCC domain-containing protein
VPEFQASTFIAAPVETVWDFHEAPGAFERLAPPWQKVTVISKKGGIEVGAEVIVSVPILGPIRSRWHARHVFYEKPHLFVDEQVSGPFAYWRHEHRMEPCEGGTQLIDTLRYALPGGAIVNLLGDWVVKIQLKSLFRFRHAVTKKSCESSVVSPDRMP